MAGPLTQGCTKTTQKQTWLQLVTKNLITASRFKKMESKSLLEISKNDQRKKYTHS